MDFGLKSFVLGSCFCIAGVLAAAQGTPCASDGGAAQGAVIACVTGAGVEIKSAVNSDVPGPDTIALAPDQRPALPPVVTYLNGKLTIVAKNSMLSDILTAVGEKTGAAIDVPDGATERVVSELGPGPARDVVAALLNGSHFNYVMVGTETNPNSVARVILTAKAESKEGTNPNTVARTGYPARTAMQQAAVRPYQEMLLQQQAQPAPPAAIAEVQSQPVPAEPPTASPAPDQANNAAAAPGSASSSGTTEAAAVDPPPPGTGATANHANAGDRTPQQMLQDMYEARRQMIQTQRQPTPAQP
jgi:hypothetical protein